MQGDNQAAYQEKSSQLNEPVAAARLDSTTSDFYYHGLPPQAVCKNLICNLVEKEYNPSYELEQEGTFR
jgi:hypothetical protein